MHKEENHVVQVKTLIYFNDLKIKILVVHLMMTDVQGEEGEEIKV